MYTSTHHDGVAIDGSLELREVRLHALVGRQGDVPHLDPEVVAGLFCFVELCPELLEVCTTHRFHII